MSEVEDGPKFPAERSNRRDFPDTKEEFEEYYREIEKKFLEECLEEFEEKAGEEDQDNN